MSNRADAHIHLFEGGFQGASFIKRLAMPIDEAVCYDSLAADHDVKAALIVGYSGAPWYVDNHDYIAAMAARYEWARPATSIDATAPPTTDELERFKAQGFVGVTLYISGLECIAALKAIPDAFWTWISDQRWLVSVNSKGEDWNAWHDILNRHPSLRVLISHLGLPPKVSVPPSADEARASMADVLSLAAYPQVHVKLSGFYAITEPQYEYPHRAAWPYVEALIAAYGIDRLLWSSDFSPCLDNLSFPQTFGLFSQMPFLSDADRSKLEGENLLALLDDLAADTGT